MKLTTPLRPVAPQRTSAGLSGEETEALAWLGRQLRWERSLTELRGRAAGQSRPVREERRRAA